MTHQMDVGPREAENRLPVISDSKDAHIRMLGLHRLHQSRPALRDVLELVDQDVAERADIAAGLGIVRGAQDHVLEVDPAAEALLVFFEDRREDVQECPGALAQLHLIGLGSQSCKL